MYIFDVSWIYSASLATSCALASKILISVSSVGESAKSSMGKLGAPGSHALSF